MKKILIIWFVLITIFLSGCLETDNQNYELGTTNTYYDSGTDSQNCGNLNEKCCEWFGRDEFGAYTARVYCNQGFECRADICTEGPDFESTPR
ncbi:MAG: hypothetical protein Q7S21_06615 [archaeon]|nr:hypothetical protein [archaeon]